MRRRPENRPKPARPGPYHDPSPFLDPATDPAMQQTFSRSLATHWTDDNQPIGITLDALLYRLRQADAADGLLFDSVTLDDLSELADAGPVLFDALITPEALLERKRETGVRP